MELATHPLSAIFCAGGGAGALVGGSGEVCVAGLPSGTVTFVDAGGAIPYAGEKASGFGGAPSAGGFAFAGYTNATKASDLGGWFNVQSGTAGVDWAGAGGSYAVGTNSQGQQIYIGLAGWAPGVGSPVNYTNINTYTWVISGK